MKKCPHCSSDQYSINVTCANCGIIYKALPHWVGLTDEEIEQGNKESWVDKQAWESAVWWAEAKLKQKNGYTEEKNNG